MRRVQDLCGIAMRKGIARYSSFLSDREQTLAQAALNRESCEEYSFDGGYPFAERKILCIEPVGPCGTPPIACVQVECFHAQDVPAHKDYLGAVLGLGLDRSSIGDIVPDPQAPGTAYVFALEPAAEPVFRSYPALLRRNPRTGTRTDQAERHSFVSSGGRSPGGDASMQPRSGR